MATAAPATLLTAALLLMDQRIADSTEVSREASRRCWWSAASPSAGTIIRAARGPSPRPQRRTARDNCHDRCEAAALKLAAAVTLLLLGFIVAAVPAASAAAVPFAAPRVITSLAPIAIDIRSADLDGDGDVDLVGSSYTDDTLRWYENNGAYPPTFTVRVIATGLNELQYIDTGDVDGDGDVDVVASSYIDNRVTLHVNNGRRPPSFALVELSTSAILTYFSSFSDLDGDGDLDVVSSFADRVVWLENLSNQSRIAFAPPRTVVSGLSGQRPYGAGFADVDRDGDTDVIQNLVVARRVVLHVNDGGPVPLFSAGSTVATGDPRSRPALVDMNGDGTTDVLVGLGSDNTFAILVGSLSGSLSTPFSPVVISTAFAGAYDVEVVDLDGDGDLDAIGAATAADMIVWFESNGDWPTPSFVGHVVASGAANSLDGCRRSRAVDVDNDGDIDIVVVSENSNSVTWIENISPINRSRFRIAFPPTLNSSTVLPRRHPHPSFGDVVTVRLLHVDGGYRPLSTSPCTINGIDVSSSFVESSRGRYELSMALTTTAQLDWPWSGLSVDCTVTDFNGQCDSRDGQ